MIDSTDASPGSQAPQPVGVTTHEPAIELRRLLAIPPAKRLASWQELVGLAVGVIANDFAKQENSELALLDIALITLAALRRSKEAKKRVIKPVRWIPTAPPSISIVFDDIEEAKCAIRVLQPIRAEWVSSYICKELARRKWPALTPALVDWLLQITPSIENFCTVISRTIQSSADDNFSWTADVLESASKSISKSYRVAGDALMSEVAELDRLIYESLKAHADANGVKEQQRVKSALLALILQASGMEPSVLTQGAIVAGLNGICTPSDTKKNFALPELEILCRRTLSLLSVSLSGADQALREHYRNIWSFYRDRLPKADQMLKKSAQQLPILRQLENQTDEVEATLDLGMSAGMEGVLCELIVNWDDYLAEHVSDPAVRQLGSRIEELNRLLGVARFGEVGKAVAFDPIRHYQSFDSPSPLSKVRVTKPGIALERRGWYLASAFNGSCRATP